jgi:hypothetical protein
MNTGGRPLEALPHFPRNTPRFLTHLTTLFTTLFFSVRMVCEVLEGKPSANRSAASPTLEQLVPSLALTVIGVFDLQPAFRSRGDVAAVLALCHDAS